MELADNREYLVTMDRQVRGSREAPHGDVDID